MGGDEGSEGKDGGTWGCGSTLEARLPVRNTQKMPWTRADQRQKNAEA